MRSSVHMVFWVVTQYTWCHNLEDHSLNLHYCENFKSYIMFKCIICVISSTNCIRIDNSIWYKIDTIIENINLLLPFKLFFLFLVGE
jgi:hypothetical protein